MQGKPTKCEGCPLFDRGRGFVFPDDSSKPTSLVVIGSGVTETDVELNQNFHSQCPSGKRTRYQLEQAGFDLETVRFANVIGCWLPKGTTKDGRAWGNDVPTVEAMGSCWRRWLQPWLGELNPRFLVASGNAARRFLLGPQIGERYNGTINRLERMP